MEEFDSIIVHPKGKEYLEQNLSKSGTSLTWFGIPVYVSEFVPADRVITMKNGKVVGWIKNVGVDSEEKSSSSRSQ